jgi:hypothetical protein
MRAAALRRVDAGQISIAARAAAFGDTVRDLRDNGMQLGIHVYSFGARRRTRRETVPPFEKGGLGGFALPTPS